MAIQVPFPVPKPYIPVSIKAEKGKPAIHTEEKGNIGEGHGKTRSHYPISGEGGKDGFAFIDK